MALSPTDLDWTGLDGLDTPRGGAAERVDVMNRLRGRGAESAEELRQEWTRVLLP